ncbi:MAG: NAD(P)-dependent oxidoreductase [Porticoccaceae bacterium]
MEQVGFIGVGMMGGAIATRMIENGVPVLAYDNNPDTLQKMCDKGATAAASVRDIADRCEIVFACLPNAEICRAVALGDGGVAGGGKVRIYIETSTVGGAEIIRLADDMARQGVTLLDSPVVGGVGACEQGRLGVLTSGPKDAFERAKPALESFAGKLFFLGDKAGVGQAGKVVNNSVAYAAVLATSEAVALGLKAGLSMETALAIINQGSGANFFSERVFPETILKGIFEGTGAIEIGVKDVKCFLDEADHLGMDTPVAKAINGIQKTILDAGPPRRDTMTIFHYFTDLAGLPRQG